MNINQVRRSRPSLFQKSSKSLRFIGEQTRLPSVRESACFSSPLTTTPGLGHTVLSGHRDTVFAGLEKLKTGDKLIVNFEEQSYTYIIEKSWVTDKDDRTVIVEKDEPTLTLTTCYPFTYIGNAPDRYILQGKLL